MWSFRLEKQYKNYNKKHYEIQKFMKSTVLHKRKVLLQIIIFERVIITYKGGDPAV